MIKLNKHGIIIESKIFNIYLNTHIYHKPKITRTIGITNVVYPNMKRIAFLDYDNYNIDMIIPELQYFQKSYKLSDAYIFKSSNKKDSYHVMFIDQMNPNELMKLLIESNCDERYKTLALSDSKRWTLRFGRKGLISPNLIRIITSPFNKRLKSKAHASFLNLQYGLNIEKLINLDDNDILPVVAYDTISNIDGEGRK